MVTVEITQTKKEKVRFQIEGSHVNYASLIRKYKSGQDISDAAINAHNIETLNEEKEYEVKIQEQGKEICLKDIIE